MMSTLFVFFVNYISFCYPILKITFFHFVSDKEQNIRIKKRLLIEQWFCVWVELWYIPIILFTKIKKKTKKSQNTLIGFWNIEIFGSLYIRVCNDNVRVLTNHTCLFQYIFIIAEKTKKITASISILFIIWDCKVKSKKKKKVYIQQEAIFHKFIRKDIIKNFIFTFLLFSLITLSMKSITLVLNLLAQTLKQVNLQ